MIYYIIALLVLVLDQISKWMIVSQLELHESRSVIGEFFQITSHRNTGAAFSILEGQRWFFLIITAVVVVAIVWYMRNTVRTGKRLMPLALSLILGGALGNFIDRALFGEVVDFLQFWFRFGFLGKDVNYIFPIFNLADMGIVIGVGMIFLDSLLEWRQEIRQNNRQQERKDIHDIHESEG